MRGSIKTANAYWNMNTLTPALSRGEREFFSNLLASACAGMASIPLENRPVLPN